MLAHSIFTVDMVLGMGSTAPDGTRFTHMDQGLQALSNESQYKHLTLKRLPFLEDTSAPNLKSINLEGMTDRTATAQDNRPLSKNERKFNQLLHLYEIKYKQITDEFLKQPSQTSAEIKAQLQFELNCINNSLMETADAINQESQDDVRKAGPGPLQDALKNQRDRVSSILRERFTGLTDSKPFLNLLGQAEDTGLRMTSNYYYYLVYIIVGVTVALLTLHAISEDGGLATGSVIFVLLLIYIFAKYFVR
jgi:hypothetical protein